MLGLPGVTDDAGNERRLPTQKAMALLAMIAVAADGGLRRERAAAMLWSRSPETQARTNLRQALSGLRAAFDGEEVVTSASGVLRLNPDLASTDTGMIAGGTIDPDADLSAIGGPFLDGMSINEPPFEEWLSTERAAQARSLRDALFDTGSAALTAGDAVRALQAAERILMLDPYEEAGLALCLRAHAAKGERSRIQLRFDEFEGQLQRELDIGIGPDLTALKTRLLSTATAPSTKPTPMNVPGVLVMPFRTLSDEPDHRYFAEGLAEDVIAQLSKFSTLAVVTHSPGPETDRPGDDVAAAAAIGADYLLTGSLRWSGDRMRLAVELIEIASRSVKWAERLDRHSSDLFALQDDLSRFLVGAIPYRIEDEVAEKAQAKPAEELQAFDLMIMGKRLRDTISLDGNLRARTLLEQAVDRDQGLARSHMYLSDSYVVENWFVPLDAEGREKALYHARRAVALDPKDVHIQDHLGFALLTMGQWDAAEAQINNALSMAENEIESMSWCGYALLLLGQHQRAGEIIEAVAQRRTTLPPTFEWILGQLYAFQGRDAEVVQTLNGASLLNSIGLAFRAGSQARLGMTDDARFTLAEFRAAREEDQRLAGLPVDSATVSAALEGFRTMWRRAEDWGHIADGLRMAGLPD